MKGKSVNMNRLRFSEKEEKQSIYQLIVENLDEKNHLSSAFNLPDNTPDNQVKFAPGAMDGIGIYHMRSGDMEDASKKLFNLLKRCSKKSDHKNREKITDFLKENNVLSVITPLLSAIQENQSEFKLSALFDLAFDFMVNSSESEAVKLGIAVCGLFNFDKNSESFKVIFILGKYDEFTLYSVVALLNQDGGNEAIFELAKELDGWGKIHAVERLDVQTQDMRDWIIINGCSNQIMPAYLGLTCAQKGDLISYLKRDKLDEDKFLGISSIIDALLDEGPVVGISEYEYADEALQLYLNHAKTKCVSLKDLDVILNIKHKLESDKTKNIVLLKMCDEIVHKPEWETLVLETLNNTGSQSIFFACNVARILGIEISDPLFNLIKSNPLEYSGYVVDLYKSPEYAVKVTELYEKALSLNSIASGMGNLLGLGSEFKAHGCLDFLLQGLNEYPGTGSNLVLTALHSPVIRNRNGACNVLAVWKEKQGIDFLEKHEFINEVQKLLDIEIDDKLKERYKELLK